METESFKDRMLHIAQIGQEADGSISRVFGSDAYEEAAREMQAYMQVSGMESYIDSVGNVHGIYRCRQKDAKEILIASHLDTVLHGGTFDGLLGVMAGIECVRKLQEEGKELGVDVHVIATNGEEGNELGGTFGGRAMMGMLPETEAFYELAEKYGYTKEKLVQALYDTSRCKCYIELHIEQGNLLEKEQRRIGVVTGIVGLERYLVTIDGQSNHAGTTMMEYRDDALVKAGGFIVEMDQKAREIGDRLVCTCSRLSVDPNVLAVINRQVSMVLECRNQKKERMQELIRAAEKLLVKLHGTISCLVQKDPVDCDQRIVQMMETVCKEKKIAYQYMPSGATHDGNCFAKKMPIGMLFVPSKNGLSHCKEEATDWDDIALGISVLYETLLRLGQTE